MPDDLLAELGPLTARIERAMLGLGGIARVHVARYGDGASTSTCGSCRARSGACSCAARCCRSGWTCCPRSPRREADERWTRIAAALGRVLTCAARTPDGPPPPPTVQRLRDALRQARAAALHLPPRLPARLRAGAAPGRRPHGVLAPASRRTRRSPTPTRRRPAWRARRSTSRSAWPSAATPSALRVSLDAALPPGLDVVEVVEAAPGALADRLEASAWEIRLPGVRPGGGTAGRREPGGRRRGLGRAPHQERHPHVRRPRAAVARRRTSASARRTRRARERASRRVRYWTWSSGTSHRPSDPTTCSARCASWPTSRRRSHLW